jgi:hypothetical protein
VIPLIPYVRQFGQLTALGSVGKSDRLVDTINQYRFAPVTDDQLKVGVVETPVAPFPGPLRVGAESSAEAGIA